MPGSFKMSFKLGFSFKMSQRFRMIRANGGRVLLNVVTKGIQLIFSLFASFKVASLGIVMAFFIWFSTKV